ncbi:MAG TPA: TetR/AcrR family transcriptional regulator [Acidimicrobiales bacterium]
MAPNRRPETTSPYHSPLRAKQAAETRRAIIDAAITLFGERGWAATTMPMIASTAGTAVDTIYSTFGSKSALMMAAIEVAIVGDDEEAAMMDRADFALLGKGRRSDRLRAGVRYTVGVYQRSVPILRALQEAAASDEAARKRLTQYDEDRRNLTEAGLALILGGAVPEKVVDAIWALTSPEVFVYLTQGRGWSVDEAEAWLVHMSTAAMRQPDTDADSPP